MERDREKGNSFSGFHLGFAVGNYLPQIMAKFRAGSFDFFWPTTSINPASSGTSYNSPSSFFNMAAYSFFTGPNGYNIPNDAPTIAYEYTPFPYWTKYDVFLRGEEKKKKKNFFWGGLDVG